MSRLRRKIRGVIGVGLTWAVGWAIVGAILALVLRLVRPGDLDAGENEVGIATIFGVAGFIAGACFGLVLSIAERRRTVGDLSTFRAAIWGAVGAAALPLLTTMTDAIASLFAPLGAVFAAASVALAKRISQSERSSDEFR